MPKYLSFGVSLFKHQHLDTLKLSMSAWDSSANLVSPRRTPGAPTPGCQPKPEHIAPFDVRAELRRATQVVSRWQSVSVFLFVHLSPNEQYR